MGFPWSRVKTWVSLETLVYSDLNAEFDNILQNNTPANINDYSNTVGQMQTQTSPGGVGSESLATSLSGEIERLRYQINQIIGDTYWYSSVPANLTDIKNAVVLASDRIVSGRVRGALSSGFVSKQPIYLTANNASGIKLKASSTNLVLYIGGTQYTVSSDLTAGPLSAAPAANNTALIDQAGMAADAWSPFLGEHVGDVLNYTGNDLSSNLYASAIKLKTVGSNISALAGKLSGFKVVDGGNTEYFIGKVETLNSVNYISYCYRGFFFDSSDAVINRIAVTDGDTITLMNLSYIFLKFTAGTPSLDVTYNQPTYSYTQPSAPASGDFWFDLNNKTWKKYNGASFDTLIAAFVGFSIQDSSGSTVAARSADFFRIQSRDNTISPQFSSASSILGSKIGEQVVVNGTRIVLNGGVASWDFTAGKDTSDGAFTPSNNDGCFLYVSEDGSFIHSNIVPYNRMSDLLGWYHPHNPWRCIGIANYASGTTFKYVTYKFYNKEFNGGLKFFSGSAVSAFSTTGTNQDVTNATVTYRSISQNVRLGVALGSGAYVSLTGSSAAAREGSFLFVQTGAIVGGTWGTSDSYVYRVVAASSGDELKIPASGLSAALAVSRPGSIVTAKMVATAVTANTTVNATGFNFLVEVMAEG